MARHSTAAKLAGRVLEQYESTDEAGNLRIELSYYSREIANDLTTSPTHSFRSNPLKRFGLRTGTFYFHPWLPAGQEWRITPPFLARASFPAPVSKTRRML